MLFFCWFAFAFFAGKLTQHAVALASDEHKGPRSYELCMFVVYAVMACWAAALWLRVGFGI
jgi:hypothetical protein